MSPLRRIARIVITFVGMSGLRLDRSPWLIALTALGMASTTHLATLLTPTRESAWVYVGLMWGIYYLGHILFFRLGLHRWMHRKLGDERAWSVYQTVLGVVFFNQGWCQVRLLETSEQTLTMPLPGSVVLGFAVLIFAAGTITKIWAVLLTSMDTYYYHDLFMDRAGDGGLVTTGVYAVFDNPMYGVGLLTAYAGALEVASLDALLVAALFQASIYVFYGVVEKPFMRRVYGPATQSASDESVEVPQAS